jgi:hypothetical protein
MYDLLAECITEILLSDDYQVERDPQDIFKVCINQVQVLRTAAKLLYSNNTISLEEYKEILDDVYYVLDIPEIETAFVEAQEILTLDTY